MATITRTEKQVNNARPAPIVVYLTTERVGIAETAEFAKVATLARWLAEQGAEHRGRVGFIVRRDGRRLRAVISRHGIQWGWRYIDANVAPAFVRARRVVSLPRIHAPAGAKPQFSQHCAGKAKVHAVAETRHQVTSGASGKVYTVTIRPTGSPRVLCSCEHGRWSQARRRDASCSHVAAVVQPVRVGA